MSAGRLSPNKDVCAEAAILVRLGFRFDGTAGSGHLLFVHPQFGEIVMAGTPRDWNWRRSHRRGVARAMGLNAFQLERKIAGQRLDGQRPRKPSKRAGRRRNRPPRASRHLSTVPESPPAVVPAPDPPKPVRVWAGSDPITDERRAVWARNAEELARLNAEERLRPRRAAA